MKTGQFITGAIVGAAVAATAVLLSTPKSGSDLRLGIKSQSTETKLQVVDAKNKSADVKHALTILKNEVQNNIPIIINEYKQTIQKFQKEIEPNIQSLKAHADELNGTMNKIKNEVEDFSDKRAKKSNIV